jgi:hypothetical protein
VQFNLNKELSKGDHSIAIETLFPNNVEFERLGTYKIPKNNMPMGLFVVGSAIFMLFSSLYFLIRFIKNTSAYRYPQLGLSILGLMLVYYMYVLLGSINIYYFPAPFNDPGSLLVSASSYLPFVLLMVIIPLVILLFKIIKYKSWNIFAVLVLTSFVLIDFVLMGLFWYWEFFDVF